jgi:hypothetical protein
VNHETVLWDKLEDLFKIYCMPILYDDEEDVV